MTRRGLAIGCGGTLGFAWTAIALQAVEQDLSWDARTASVLVGTSAGAEMVALLGSGRSVTDVVHALGSPGPGIRPPLPRLRWPALGLLGRRDLDPLGRLAGLLPEGGGDATWLREFGARLAGPNGWVEHPATWIVAADARTGERVAFGSPGAPRVPLGEAIAASWAIPGWFPPVSLAGRRFVDGGTVSSVSADLVAPLELDELVVVAPMTSRDPVPARGLTRLERVLRRRMTRGLDRELRTVAGTRVIRVEPDQAALAAMGFNFMDHRRLPATITAARGVLS
ncbi:patatin-like phospholipase family protein [Lentzea sp. JNUCC 0626]|uniref:patatin-like phospholipase family protein n=1 Tax=Lentzea sp. JNUCC 0626 TaxID=3367513 RepID=UPI003749FE0D